MPPSRVPFAIGAEQFTDALAGARHEFGYARFLGGEPASSAHIKQVGECGLGGPAAPATEAALRGALSQWCGEIKPVTIRSA